MLPVRATDGTVFVDFTDIRPGSLDVFLCLAVKTNGAAEPQIHAGIAFKANNMAIQPSWKSNKWNAVLIHRLGNGLALDVRDSMDDFAQTLKGPISADKYGFIHVGSVNSGLLCNGTAVMSADLQRNFGIRGFRQNPRGQKLTCKNYCILDLFWPFLALLSIGILRILSEANWEPCVVHGFRP